MSDATRSGPALEVHPDAFPAEARTERTAKPRRESRGGSSQFEVGPRPGGLERDCGRRRVGGRDLGDARRERRRARHGLKRQVLRTVGRVVPRAQTPQLFGGDERRRGGGRVARVPGRAGAAERREDDVEVTGGLLDVVTPPRGGVGANGERAPPLAEQEYESRDVGDVRRARRARGGVVWLQLRVERVRREVRVDAGTERRDDDVGGSVRGGVGGAGHRAIALQEHLHRGGVVVEGDADVHAVAR